jgi:pimeloyl-ACP methyl ester carboxylesterase
MVAVEWARRYPAELAGAVLINTSLRGLNPLYQRLAWRCWPLLVRTALTRDATRREARILQLTSALTEIPPDLIARRVMIQQAHPVRLSNVFRQLWAAARYAAPSDKPLIPLLLLNSAGDTMVAPQCSLTIAQRWEVPLKTHTWAGHDLPLDDPAWVVDTVVDWLNQDR